jgi:hypothetical protein
VTIDRAALSHHRLVFGRILAQHEGVAHVVFLGIITDDLCRICILEKRKATTLCMGCTSWGQYVLQLLHGHLPDDFLAGIEHTFGAP